MAGRRHLLRRNTPRFALTQLPGRILLAEDDDEMRRLLASQLRRDGHEVVESSDSSALVRQLDHASGSLGFDLIISDVRMRGMSGLELLALLRRRDALTPVILMTAFGDEATRSQAGRLGVSGFFDKPFDVETLCAAARSLASPTY